MRGIGLPGFARLLGLSGPLDRFSTVSKLWKHLGMSVTEEGSAPKRKKGERFIRTSELEAEGVFDRKGNAYSPQGRTICHQIGDAIVKVGGGGPYRAAYDAKKAYYEQHRPDWTPLHRHNAAMRYAVKMLLKDLWVEWQRRQQTLAA